MGIVSWQAPEPYYHDYEIQVQGSRYRYDKARGAYVYESPGVRQLTRQPGPDPELELYTEVTGRRVYASYTHAAWRNEYAATGQSIAMERMLALVTETTHCDALDGPAAAPVPVKRGMSRPDWIVLVFLVAVALTAVLLVVL